MKRYYCFLERFNNYFNRKIIKYETLLEYQNSSDAFYIPVDAHGTMMPFDFNPNDNVMTEIIANDVPFDPDYFLLLDADQNIIQRWFVLEQKRNRQGQWTYELRRDVISDNLDFLRTSPIYVHRGMVSDDSPLITNDEGMSLNQIKTSEMKLMDQSNSAWILIYLAKNAAGTGVNVNIPISKAQPDAITLQQILADLAAFPTPSKITTEQELLDLLTFPEDANTKDNRFWESVKFTFNGRYDTRDGTRLGGYFVKFKKADVLEDIEVGTATPTPDLSVAIDASDRMYTEASGVDQSIALALQSDKSNVMDDIASVSTFPYLTERELAYFRSLMNTGKKIIYNGRYFSINNIAASGSATTNDTANFSASSSAHVSAAFSAGVTNYGASDISFNSNATYHLELLGQLMYIQLQEYTAPSAGTLITTVSGSRLKTINQEFDAIAIPVSGLSVYNGSYEFLSCEYVQAVASEIAIQLDAAVYDVQLLPYCPIPSKISENNTIDISTMTEGFEFNWITLGLPSSGSTTLSTDRNIQSITHGSIIYGPPYLYTVTLFTPFPAGVTLSNLTPILKDPRGTGVVDVSTLTVQEVTLDNKIILQIQFRSNWDPDKAQTILSDNGISIDVNLDYDFGQIPSTSVHTGIMFYLQDTTFRNSIYANLRTKASLKIDSNCDLYRLVSPNYQGSFDFNLAKNGGKVDSFLVECTYKPFTPLIKVAPNFSWLYGSNFGDNRGLICGGDFSLPRATSAWENYQLNNKNYQNIFNREIQSMDFKYGIERRNAIISGVAGILGDTAKGAGAGAYLGGPIGAAVGGVVAGASSAIGMAVDIDTQAKLYQEEKSLAIDKFNYQLGNIKALPNTMTKVGSFDAISKIFPILEYYTCTPKEKLIFMNKIRYESMTVMCIGTINEYSGNDGELHYFKGELIRCDEIADDAHVLDAIYRELLKGVYL